MGNKAKSGLIMFTVASLYKEEQGKGQERAEENKHSLCDESNE